VAWLRCCSGIWLEGLRKPPENLVQNGRCVSRYSNQPPEYKSRVLSRTIQFGKISYYMSSPSDHFLPASCELDWSQMGHCQLDCCGIEVEIKHFPLGLLVWFEVLTPVTMKIIVSWELTPSSLVDRNEHFEDISWLYLLGGLFCREDEDSSYHRNICNHAPGHILVDRMSFIFLSICPRFPLWL
jgi:hypothetical protein